MTGTSRQVLPYQEYVAEDIAAIFPPQVKTVLDVGCGDGYAAERLPQMLNCIGVDRSVESLRLGKGKRVGADVAKLPFADRSFDLVMANDMLEHLSNSERAQALLELARVSKRHILVTVPLLEDLNLACVKCASCKRLYHANHHRVSFGLTELNELFNKNGYPCVRQVITGDVWQSRPHDLLFLQRYLALGFPTVDTSVCPFCESTKVEAGARREVINVILDRLTSDRCLHDRMTRDMMFLRTECISMYEKNRVDYGCTGQGFLDQQLRSVPLNDQVISGATISFTNPELYRKQFFPIYSLLPYFICEHVSAMGAVITPDNPACIGFFVRKKQNDMVQLMVRGETERATTLRVWHYDTYRTFHSPVCMRVSGKFSVTLNMAHVSLSRYGWVFQLQSDQASIVVNEVTLLHIEDEGIRLFHNRNSQARFLRLPGNPELLLSLPFYGSHLVELEWMRNPEVLASPGTRLLASTYSSTESERLLQLVEPFCAESDHLFRTLTSLDREYGVLQAAHNGTLGRRIRRVIDRLTNRV